MDFTDMSKMNKISTTKPSSGGNAQSNAKTKKKEEFKMTQDGKLIIADSDSEEEVDTEKKMGQLKILDEEDEDKEEDAKDILNQRKRKRGSSVKSEPASKYQAGGSGIHRPINNTKTKSEAGSVHTTRTQDPGSVYKSKKSQGDMKRKGLPDPYAYVPLTRKLLNKRKKNKATGQFKNIIKGAKKGAKVGTSMKSKNSKRNKK